MVSVQTLTSKVAAPLLFFDPETRELLRTRPNRLERGDAARLHVIRPGDGATRWRHPYTMKIKLAAMPMSRRAKPRPANGG
jgi:hypothetical protein